MLTSRARVLAAVRHELPDRVPIDAIAIENQPELARCLGIPQDQVLEALEIDGRIVNAPYTGELLKRSTGEFLSEWGTVKSDYGTTQPHPLADATTKAHLDAYPWPDADRYDFDEAAQVAAAQGERYALRGPYFFPLFCRLCDLFGMQEAMLRLLLQPAIFEDALERVFRYTYEHSRRLLGACGERLPILCLGDDFATQRGMMISPAHWRKYLKPRYARLFELGKRSGKFIWFHSCGDITAVLPDLIDIGMDVWETVQLHTLSLPAAMLKREYGRHITFFGGVNTQRLPFAAPMQVRDEVRRCIDALGKGGGYICGPDHHIKPDVSAVNTVALFETARSYQKQGYTGG